MSIPRPAESAYDVAPPEVRAVIDQIVSELRGTPDWNERLPVLLEMVDALDLIVGTQDADAGEDEEDDDARAAGIGAAPTAGDSLDTEAWGEDSDFELGQLVTYYMGAILEQLDEREMTSPEQVAFYLLSCHPEHLEAAQHWLEQPGNQDRFQNFVEANPDYDAVLEMIEEMYEDMTDEE